jgi:hypothetical protein
VGLLPQPPPACDRTENVHRLARLLPQVLTSMAAAHADPANPRSFNRVVIGHRYIFASLFDGLVGDAAARFCADRAFEVRRLVCISPARARACSICVGLRRLCLDSCGAALAGK